MPDSDPTSPDPAELDIAFDVAKRINCITEYYERAIKGLLDDTGNGLPPYPEAVHGHLRLDTVRKTVLEHSKQGKVAILSLNWSLVESAEERLRKIIDQFDVKIKEVKAADRRWDGVNEDNTMRPTKDSKLYQICIDFWDTLGKVPLIPSIKRNEPPTRSSLEPHLPTFEYMKLESPMDTIRVVRMESISSSRESPIYLTTRLVGLQDNVPFATLSYTWGNPFGIFCSESERDTTPRTDIPIICDGKRIEIAENLYRFLIRWRASLAAFKENWGESPMPDALERARPPSEFWIDALCINQQDIEEKNHQVSLMGEIYNKCAKTWIWLGEEDQFSQKAFELLEILANISQDDAGKVERVGKAENMALLIELGLPGFDSWRWFALFALFERQWFRRSWVMQEAALSRDIYVVCGSLCVPWGGLVMAHQKMKQLRLLDAIGSVGMQELRPERFQFRTLEYSFEKRVVLKKSKKASSDLRFHPCHEGIEADMASVVVKIARIKITDPDLPSDDGISLDNKIDATFHFLDLWELSRKTLCSNPRDKVYAVASLANRDIYKTPDTIPDRRPLVPDYKKSVCEVYCDSAWFILLTQASLDMFSLIGHTPQQNEHGLPSWVPDLSQSPHYRALGTIQSVRPGPGWSADAGTRWQIPPAAMRYRRHLRVQVSFVGKIQDRAQGEYHYEDTHYKNKKPFNIDYKQLLDFSKLLPPTYFGDPNGQTQFEVLWRTVIADYAGGISPASPMYAEEFGKDYSRAFRSAHDDYIVGNVDNNDFFLTLPAMNDLIGDDSSAMMEKMDVVTDETAEFHHRAFQTMGNRRLLSPIRAMLAVEIQDCLSGT